MRPSIYIFIFSITIFIVGCHNPTQSSHTEVVNEWKGKTIQMPSAINWKSMGKDTTCSSILNFTSKILVYIDSTGCTPCKFRTLEWKTLIDICRQNQIPVSFLFVIHSSNYDELGVDFLIHDFSHPVIYDKNNNFDKLNHFPPAPYCTFLLDKDNKVQLIGSPINNPKMWELYKKIITQQQ